MLNGCLYLNSGRTYSKMSAQQFLLIDDDDDDQEIFLTALESLSDTVGYTAVSDAADALKRLGAGELRADLIFLDLNMPGMTGQQFLTEIKKKDDLKNIPVIIFSTSSHKDTIRETKEAGAYDFITKPDKFDDLITILSKFVR